MNAQNKRVEQFYYLFISFMGSSDWNIVLYFLNDPSV